MPRPHLYWIKLLYILVIVALIASACSRSDGNGSPFTQLTASNPIAQSAAGLTVSVNPSTLKQAFGVQITAAPADAASKAAPLPAHLQLQGSLFFTRPLSLIIIGITVLLFSLNPIRACLGRLRGRRA